MFGFYFLLFNLIVLLLFFASTKGWLDQPLEIVSNASAALLRFLRSAFPLMDELTVFVIATSFLLVDLVDPALSPNHYSIATLWLDGTIHMIQGSWSQQALDDTAGQLAIYLILTTFIFAPLLMPFTNWNLRPICIPYIMIDAGVIAVTNRMRWQENASELNLLFFLYSCAWLIYIVLVFLHPRLKKADTLIPSKQANPLLAISCGVTSWITIELLIRRFNWHWTEAYTSATLAASYTASIFTALALRIKAARYDSLPPLPEQPSAPQREL